jgi:phosphoribosylamine--glycine ligase
LARTASGQLAGVSVTPTGAAVTVVLASEGYPQSPRTGDVIEGLGPNGQLATPSDQIVVFHAGTKRTDDGHFVTNGGRVLAVTGLGDTLEEARTRAYQGAGLINFKGSVRRSDIALVATQGVT